MNFLTQKPLQSPPAIASRPLPWWRRGFGVDAPHAYLVYAAGVFGLLSAVTLWVAFEQHQADINDIQQDTKLITPAAADRLSLLVHNELSPLRRLLRALGSGTINTADEFVSQATSLQARHAARAGADELTSAVTVIVWVDEQGVVQAVHPEQNTTVRPGKSIKEYPNWSQVYANSQRPRRNAIITGEFDGRPTQWVSLPYTGVEAVGRRRGAVLARADFSDCARQTFHQGNWWYFDLLVQDQDERVIYSSLDADQAGRYGAEREFNVFDSTWHVHVFPREEFLAIRVGDARMLVLFAGFPVALVLSFGTAQAMLHRRRDRIQLAALAALSKISAALTDRPGDATAVLSQLSNVAAQLMHMSKSSVTLLDPRDGMMHVVYRNGVIALDGRDIYDKSETPLSIEVMETGRPRFVGNTEASGSPFEPGRMPLHGIRSLILLPLIAGGQAMGVILLAHEKPRKFTLLDRQLVELWMAEASVILSNRKLYEGLNAALKSLQKILEQRETLYEVHARIQRAQSLQESLRLIAELAPRALEVDACVVGLAHPVPGMIEIAAVTPEVASAELHEKTVIQCSTCASVLQTTHVQLVEDLSQQPVKGFPQMGSALFVPLAAGGANIGMLVLLRTLRGPFDGEQVRMAELFAARTSSAIESTRLHEQTLRQAETNSILLRELNHRVGNNLASIVALLTMGARELPHESRQWLQRTTERVSMMARAHELFSGGEQSVRLDELIRTTLGSVSAVKGPDVQVTLQLSDEELALPSTRAITLAMVLHELAYNAVVHALSDGGDLIVRAARVAGNRMTIEVIDRPAVPVPVGGSSGDPSDAPDGSGNGDPERTRRPGGIGLQLVRHLVARELRGSFTMSRSDDGTVATLQIPIVLESCSLEMTT